LDNKKLLGGYKMDKKNNYNMLWWMCLISALIACVTSTIDKRFDGSYDTYNMILNMMLWVVSCTSGLIYLIKINKYKFWKYFLIIMTIFELVSDIIIILRNTGVIE